MNDWFLYDNGLRYERVKRVTQHFPVAKIYLTLSICQEMQLLF